MELLRKINRRSALISVGVKLFGMLAGAVCVYFLVLDVSSGNHKLYKSLFQTVGSFAEYFVILSGALWLIRWLWRFGSRWSRKTGIFFKEVYVLLRAQHVSIGWIGFFVAASHGVYFLIAGSKHADRIYSGIAALLLLGCVAAAGILLNRGSKKQYAIRRHVHRIVAVGFGVGLLVHLML